jgi:hypothetical protein
MAGAWKQHMQANVLSRSHFLPLNCVSMETSVHQSKIKSGTIKTEIL